MPSEIKRVYRPLTPEDRAKYRKIREQIEAEKPAINARIKARLAELGRLDQVFLELKKVREQQGLSLADLKELTGMDRSLISRLETGRQENFTIDTVQRYAEALGKKVVVSLVDTK